MMMWTAGIDIGSTYTKAALACDGELVARALEPTGFRLAQVAETVLQRTLADAGIARSDVAYIISTGFGRHQVDISDAHVTDLTAAARGATGFFPGTRTILDVGGQTMKAIRLSGGGKVDSFRLNDKCAAGTGAFLEKTARYMGYGTTEIGPLVATSHNTVPISGVCAVFAESEVINQLSQGAAPADIMHGAIVSLVGRSVQLMKRVRMEPEFTLIGGILRFERMIDVVRAELSADVNVPSGDLVQYTAAIGAAQLAHTRVQKLRDGGVGADVGSQPLSASA
jgi:predicted CoA-substrate-specific enzyme activase